MADSEVEICLFWGNWQIQQWWSCMPRSSWSGWVQLLATLLIGVIAVYVPAAIEHSKQRAKKKSDYSRAAIVAVPLWKRVEVSINFLKYLRAEVDASCKIAFNEMMELMELMPKYSIATEDQLLAVSIIMPKSAIEIAECNEIFDEIRAEVTDIYKSLLRKSGESMRTDFNTLAWNEPRSKALKCLNHLEEVLRLRDSKLNN